MLVGNSTAAKNIGLSKELGALFKITKAVSLTNTPAENVHNISLLYKPGAANSCAEKYCSSSVKSRKGYCFAKTAVF